MTQSVFEKETAVEAIGGGQWRAELVAGWRIGKVPCGGYPLAIAGRALADALPHPDPLSVHILYVAPTVIGPANFDIEVLSSGANTSHGLLKMYQGDELKTVITGSYTELGRLEGENWSSVERPEILPYDRCPPFGEHGIELRQRVNQCYASGDEVFRRGTPDGSGCFNGWLSFTDNSDVDLLGLLMLADAFPPPVFTVFGAQGWVPTIELTVQLRARPCSGPIQVRFTSRYLTNGVMEEDGELWDSEGKLVALSRQTGKLRIPRT